MITTIIRRKAAQAGFHNRRPVWARIAPTSYAAGAKAGAAWRTEDQHFRALGKY